MRLTDYTDYSLRVMMFCALNPGRSVTIAELADSHAVSKNHLMKIVNDLARQGWLQTTRGRGGGLRLLKPAADITIGALVRHTETDFRLVECFDTGHNTCTLTRNCQLQQVFVAALERFMTALDQVTLADVTRLLPAPHPGHSRSVSVVPASVVTPSAAKTSVQLKATRSASRTRA